VARWEPSSGAQLTAPAGPMRRSSSEKRGTSTADRLSTWERRCGGATSRSSIKSPALTPRGKRRDGPVSMADGRRTNSDRAYQRPERANDTHAKNQPRLGVPGVGARELATDDFRDPSPMMARSPTSIESEAVPPTFRPGRRRGTPSTARIARPPWPRRLATASGWKPPISPVLIRNAPPRKKKRATAVSGFFAT